MNKMLRLGILYGSRSSEHEVSIISALQLAAQANPFKYEVIPVYISKKGEWFIGGKLWQLSTYLDFDPRKSGLTRVYPDVTARSRALVAYQRKGVLGGAQRVVAARLDCVIPVFHGLHGEDGSMQGLLELMDIPYAETGVPGSAIGMDKIMMKRYFRGCGFPVLPDTYVTRQRFENGPDQAVLEIEKAIAYPVIVKPANSGSSIGVSPAHDRKALVLALELAFALDRRVLVEPLLDRPQEVNCAVMGFSESVFPSVVEQPVRGEDSEVLDFEGKYLRSPGEGGMANLSRIIPAPISPEQTKRVQDLSVAIFKSLDCKGVVRIDYMIDRGTQEMYITEINTIPGSLAYYLWDKTGEGIPYRELVDRLVELAFEAQAQKENSLLSFQSDIIKAAVKNPALGVKGSK